MTFLPESQFKTDDDANFRSFSKIFYNSRKPRWWLSLQSIIWKRMMPTISGGFQRYLTLLGHCADDFLVGVRKKSRESTWLSLTRQMSRMPPNRSLGPKSYARYYARTFWEGFCRGSGALDNSIIPGHPADDFLIKVWVHLYIIWLFRQRSRSHHG